MHTEEELDPDIAEALRVNGGEEPEHSEETSDQSDQDDQQEDEPELDDDHGNDASDEDNSRGGRRIQNLSQRTRDAEKQASEARTEARELRERLARLEAAQNNSYDSRQRDAEEQARLAIMSPEERRDYEHQKQIEAMNQKIRDMGFTQADSQDRTHYRTMAASNPLFAKYETQVESALQSLRAKGVVAPREEILYHLVGKLAVTGALKAQAKKQSGAEKTTSRVDNARGNPPSARTRTEGSSNQKSRVQTLEERLDGVLL